ncbi:MAG: hypothetical protein RR540_00950 [Oscillospiraceae bacterium]
MANTENEAKKCSASVDDIKKILEKYTKADYKIFFDTTDMICKKGIARGTYQDTGVMVDVVTILSICESIIKDGSLEQGANV